MFTILSNFQSCSTSEALPKHRTQEGFYNQCGSNFMVCC